MKLYAVVDKDGNIALALPYDQELKPGSKYTLKELHTYDPATQVVVDREVYDCISRTIEQGTTKYCSTQTLKQFLSAGKEAT